MKFETSSVDVPAPAMTGAERQRKYRQAGKEAPVRKKYRHDNSKHTTDAKYLARKFRAFDGEGVTLKDGSHIYTMFASKLYGEPSTDILDSRGLSSVAIFDYILKTAKDDAINVIYGGSYDFNMWLSDMSESELRNVYSRKFYQWRGYRLSWRRGKSFTISRVTDDGKKIGRSVTVYDVVSFFQCVFVKACDDYLGDDFVGRDEIIAQKAARGTFKNEDLHSVRHYNELELENLLRLVYELRARLNKVGLRPRRWDGPGAVAAALLAREGVKNHLCEAPPEVAQAARYAYAGGRFEVIKFGHVVKPAWEYDVNSAYPSALRHVPSLAHGVWKRYTGAAAKAVRPFAIYHIEYEGFRKDIPGALFRRHDNGSISYPLNVTGWYWSPEYEVTREYCERGYGKIRVLEAWVFIPDVGAPKPFEFIEGLYNKRRALKKAKDGAHVGIKLALNSLYGKLAQQVGAEFRNGKWSKPPFHQLEYAGYTTSYCRAKVLRAVLDNLDDVIAFETDAVFSSTELSVPVSSNLGDFGAVVFGDLSYVQSGLYFGESETNIAKTRGVDRGTLTRSEVLAKMTEPKAADRFATVHMTRFTGAGLALMQGFHKWRRWEVVSKNLTLEPTGKRVHVGCKSDRMGGGINLGKWHTTICPFMQKTHSAEFPIVWINPNPDMHMLEELREEITEYE